VPRIVLETLVAAPIERVFDLARSIDLHLASAAATSERAVAGVTTGLIGPGETVTWRARHLGLWHELTARITAYARPTHFRDEMVRGPFRRMVHDHHFEARDGGTHMRDVFDFASPFGPLGAVVDRLYLTRYLGAFLAARQAAIRAAAESAAWRRVLPADAQGGP